MPTVPGTRQTVQGELTLVSGMEEARSGSAYVKLFLELEGHPQDTCFHVFGLSRNQQDRLDKLTGKYVAISYHVNEGIGRWKGDSFNVVDRIGYAGDLVWRT